MGWNKRRKSPGEETANWWFSDEDLQDAVSHIIDVPSQPRKQRKPEPLETQVITHKEE